MDVNGVEDNDLAFSVEMASSLIPQLKEAFAKAEAYKDGSEHNVQWEDIEAHFRQTESMVKEKLEGLKAKEAEFAKKESEIRKVMAEREATVAAKEQEMLNDVQDLKDATVAAIFEAQSKHIPLPTEPLKSIEVNDNKVSSSIDVENAPVHDVGEKTDALAQSSNPMDANELHSFIMEHQKDVSAINNRLSVAVSSATEPARLVLDLLKRFISSANSSDASKGIRQSFLVVLEALATVLAKANSSEDDSYLNDEIKAQAKGIADEWRAKLGVVEGNDAAKDNGKSLEIEGFLRLVAIFRIGSEFDQDELCKLVLALAHRHRQATELCLSLGLTQKMPGIIELLINNGKLIEAVHLSQAFKLSDAYPPVPLLMAYLKDVRRNSQGKRARFGKDASLQAVINTRELTALKTVVKCVKDYNLQSDYPLEPLESRITQLQKSKLNPGKKKINASPSKYKPSPHPPKRARPTSTFPRHNHSGRITNFTHHPQPYLTERPPPPAPTTSIYSYPISNQAVHYAYPAPDTQERYSAYSNVNVNANANPNPSQGGYIAHLANEQKPYHYAPAGTANAGYSVGAPSYASYTTAGSDLHLNQPQYR